ncbi:MAG: sugar nucleotide-binding protein, partial [Candidatus Magasanikbacteria bacterium]|nr:sugar nucleotide-binding protein [Candidatus Magasanikbacteria bacterium]
NLYPMFSDQTISPTFIDDIFWAIELLITKKHKGIFHLGSSALTTPFEFAKELVRTFEEDADKIKKGSLAAFLDIVGNAPRPLKGGMIVEKITKLGFEPTDYKTGIKNLFSQVRSH